MTTLLIGGDVCPTQRDTALFEQGRADRLFQDLCGEFQTADFSAINLECPLIAQTSPIEKDGPPLGHRSAVSMVRRRPMRSTSPTTTFSIMASKDC